MTSVLIILFLSNLLTFYTVDIEAQQIRLIVSAAEDPVQNSTFSSHQIVQIIIDDPLTRDPDTNTDGLVVKGQQMQ